ncbi:MAG: hypothetical protein IKA17_09800 [Clostridia bacterium]|nr:hypothetical protein [Clostridia bacterium]
MPRSYRHIKEYEKEILELKSQGLTEGEIGKQTDAVFSLAHRKEVKTSVKYMVIYRHKDQYSISEMCRFFNVSRMDIPA